MPTDTTTILHALDTSTLTQIIQQAPPWADYEVTDWTVEPINHTTLIDTTGGLYRLKGYVRQGAAEMPWSVVLKILSRPDDGCLEPGVWCYWKREALAYQSGVLASLPESIRTPRYLGISEYDDSVWIWIEDISDLTSRSWSLTEYRWAAHQFGRFGGAFLQGVPVPNDPWLCSPFLRSSFADDEPLASFNDPASPGSVWSHPLVQQAFADPLRSRVLTLWNERERYLTVLDQLPQVFCHADVHRRNLMIQRNLAGENQLVVVDWAFSGRGALGSDAGMLGAVSMYWGDIDVGLCSQLQHDVFDGYLAGLRAAGWSGDQRVPRLGFLLSGALWMGTALPAWAAIMLGDGTTDYVKALYGDSADAVLARWVTLDALMLDQADEADELIKELRLA